MNFVLLVTCCGAVMVENFDGQTSRMGLYTKMSDGTSQNALPVYANSDSSQFLWMSGTNWVIGPDHTQGSIGIQSAVSWQSEQEERKL